MDDEFDNFMERVTEVERLVTQMRSSDTLLAESARRRADVLLGPSTQCPGPAEPRSRHGPARPAVVASEALKEGGLDADDEGGVRTRTDRVVINQKAFDRIGSGGGSDPAEMSKECFMAQVEKDAEDRAKEGRECKQRSSELRRRANDAFREKHFEKALNLYSKAIDETRDSAILYENRALTCLHLELYQRTVDNCNWALRLNENSLKALLYKAKALHQMQDTENSQKCILTALEKHAHHMDIINDYVETWRQDGPAQKNTKA